jgi:hypothetical protein
LGCHGVLGVAMVVVVFPYQSTLPARLGPLAIVAAHEQRTAHARQLGDDVVAAVYMGDEVRRVGGRVLGEGCQRGDEQRGCEEHGGMDQRKEVALVRSRRVWTG